MRYFLVFTFLILPNLAVAASFKDIIVGAITEAIGPPGEDFGKKSNIMVVNADGDVTFIFLCSAGKEGGLGDKAVDVIYEGINKATIGLTLPIEYLLKGAIARGFVVEGDAFCAAIATKTGTKKRAPNISDGSIYVTSWRDGEKVESVTDKKYCKRISTNYVCYEIAEGPITGGDEVDGVSGCFQAKIDGKLVSYSFGRGGSAPEDVKQTMSEKLSKSDMGCVARSLGVEKY